LRRSPSLAAGAPRPAVRFGGQVRCCCSRGKTGWQALVGLPLDTPLGEQAIEVGPEARRVPFQVGPKAYPEQRLTLKNPKMVSPDPDDLDRIAAERERQIRVRSQFRDVPVARTDLDLPTAGRLSSRFGLRRVFNGEPRAPHTGLDVAAPAGAPIRAPADGVVSLVDDLYFNGKTVFVDHGQGFVSMVCHLEPEPAWRPARRCAGAKLLGLVGSSWPGHRAAPALERLSERRGRGPGALHRADT
jgi:hypothetical protein